MLPTPRSNRPTVRLARRAIAAVAVLSALTAGACGTDPEPSAVRVDYAATAFDSGAPVSLDELRGTPVLLSSWAMWCLPCKTELPELEAFQQTRDDLDVVVVNVDTDDVSDSELRAEADDLGLTMPIWRDQDAVFVDVFRGVGFPTHALLDADGGVVSMWSGMIDFEDPEFLATIDDVTG